MDGDILKFFIAAFAICLIIGIVKSQALVPRDSSKYFTDPKMISFLDAIQRGNLKQVKKDIADGIDVNAVGKQGFRPIFFGYFPGNSEVLKYLLNSGANPNVKLETGDTPLHYAVTLENPEFTAVLLAAGADPNARGENDKTVLRQANYAERVENIKLLVAGGADINAVWGGDTELISALTTFNWTVATSLLDLGADVEYKDKLGRDAVGQFCKQMARIEAVPKNRKEIPVLVEAFKRRNINLPCEESLQKFR